MIAVINKFIKKVFKTSAVNKLFILQYEGIHERPLYVSKVSLHTFYEYEASNFEFCHRHVYTDNNFTFESSLIFKPSVYYKYNHYEQEITY